MSIVHFVYSRDPSRTSAPYCIGNEIGDRLVKHYPVRFHDWRSTEPPGLRPGDVLVGHPHRRRGTAWRRGAAIAGLSRRILLAPYVPDLRQVGWLDPLVDRADVFLAITGKYWFDRLADSPVRRWAPRMRHVDLAVDPARFPPLRDDVRPPGQRRIVYIGHTAHNKNVGYLAALQAAMPETRFGWIGRPGRRRIPGVEALGPRDLGSDEGRACLAQFDILVTVGHCDANPTTLLEAIAWGLVPACTRQSGYEGQPGIVNVPLDDVPGAVAQLRMLQQCPSETLRALQAAGREALARHFHWDRVYAQVRQAIDSRESPAALAPATWAERLRLWPSRLVL